MTAETINTIIDTLLKVYIVSVMFAMGLTLSVPQIREQIKRFSLMGKALLISSSQFAGLGAELVVIAFAFVMYAVAALATRSWYHEFLKPVYVLRLANMFTALASLATMPVGDSNRPVPANQNQ